MKNKITRHLRETEMTYFQHMVRACTMSTLLFFALLACITHAIFPFLFENTASSIIKNLSKKI